MLGVGVRYAVCTRDMTCDFCIDWSPAQWELFAKKRTYKERKRSRPSDSVPPALGASPRAGTSSEVPQPGTSSSSSSRPSGGQDERGGVHLVLRPVRLPPLPLDLGPASAPPSLQLLRELQRGGLLGRSGLPLPAPLPRLLLPTHHSMLRDVMSWEKLRWTAPVLDPPVLPDLRIEEQGRIVEPVLDRTALVTVAVVLTLAPLTVRGRERRRQSSSRSLLYRERSRSSVRSRSRGDQSRSSNRYRSRRDRSRSSDRYRSCRQRSRSPARRGGRRDCSRSSDLPRRSRDRSRPRGRSPPSSDRSRPKERGRRARRERQEGVETVTVSQAPAVFEAPAAVVPPVGGATMAALPSAVQDLARFFLNLAGSSSLGAVGGVAGVAASASGVGVQLCPSASGGDAVTSCAATAVPAGVSGPPSVSAAVPGSSGRQQCQETSRPSRRCRRSSSDGSVEAASKGSVSFRWTFFSLPGEVLSVILRVF